MKREEMVERLDNTHEEWDVVIIGGGATGMGAAIDAASRGHKTILLEQDDFCKGTSSRSTKLVHGGVRYLQQFDVPLVFENLKERGIMRQNAPHLVHDLPFIVPNYAWWETPWYFCGLQVYDILSLRYSFGRSCYLTPKKTLERLPTLQPKGLLGSILYHDGQFDDARTLISLAVTAHEQGATLINYCPVIDLLHDGSGRVCGVRALDKESGKEYEIKSKSVMNCAGPFADKVRRMDDESCQNMVAPSTGVHIVLDRSFIPLDAAIMVPRTSDGRVMFAIPWQDCVVVGTTDNKVPQPELEPIPTQEEVEFILENAQPYFAKAPSLADVRSVFSGIRPLIKATGEGNTAKLSRDHSISVSKNGLVTIGGGKWTTYRRMAEDLINHAEDVGHLDKKPCLTKTLNIHGYHRNAEEFGKLGVYGSDAPQIQQLAKDNEGWAETIHPQLSALKAQVIWGVRQEMARKVEDVLARRTRSLLFDAQASIEAAPTVAHLMAGELHRDEAWEKEQVAEFTAVAKNYLPAKRA